MHLVMLQCWIYNAIQQASKDLADLEKENRAQNRKDLDERFPWFKNQQSFNKTEKWEFGMSSFQYTPDPTLDRFKYFVQGFVCKDEIICPVVLTEDPQSVNVAQFPIVDLSVYPQIKMYTTIGRETKLVHNYKKIEFSFNNILEQEIGLNEDESFEKREQPVRKFWVVNS